MNDQAHGYHCSTFSRPVVSSTRAELISTAMLSRSTACITERAGGHWKSSGNTDHSLTSSSGMDAMPVMTCTPCVSRYPHAGVAGSGSHDHGWYW